MLLRSKISERSSLISPRRRGPNLRLGCPAVWDDFHGAIHEGSHWPVEARPFLLAQYPNQHPPQVLAQGHLLLEAYQKHVTLGNWRLSLKSTHEPVSSYIPIRNTDIEPHSSKLRNISIQTWVTALSPKLLYHY